MWIDGWKDLVSYFQWHSCHPQAPRGSKIRLAGLASPCLTTSYRSWRTPVWRERRRLSDSDSWETSVSVWRIDTIDS